MENIDVTENVSQVASGDYSVNVNIESLETAHEKLNSLLNSIEEALKNADAAGKAAVEAAGGESTRVGQAISESLVAVNSNEFVRVKERVTNLSEGVRIIQTAYTQEQDELVNAINKYKDGYQFEGSTSV